MIDAQYWRWDQSVIRRIYPLLFRNVHFRVYTILKVDSFPTIRS